ncbi:glycine/D-amino acid oxidase-like deaminating enzyme [Rhizobium sp. BK313]|jgi:glycine/D-amino acid oxidase-like deaminating enzyme|uniref:NAD(P)/FAD-dependent oxidoreductase n=1 Tax=Rhizobium sp. BK313 TaxID=2587081 RepID=UPI00105F7827|nr:FAD-dependent oxidoreductase [Rhizobium sp. BK313]MBB3454034.1 glycine/D-amino acid oxidase-like deaminating enzyme [Rhizobium sp. BK313]
MQIAVVGAGIVGASIAYHLARRGARVHLFDEGPAPAAGVTGKAFGWVNLINGEPTTNYGNYRIWREAITEYQRLKAALPDALQHARSGSLIWHATVAETEALVQEHQAAGATVELVDAKTIAWWEPELREVPECAAFSPDDLALDPTQLTQTLVHAAIAFGARADFNQKIVALETSDGRVTGVRTAEGAVSADVVVLATGTSVDALISSFGLAIGVESSPAVLLQFSADRPFLNRILRGPDLEVRQRPDHSLVAAASYRGDSEENGPTAIGHRMLDVMKRKLALPEGVELRQATVGYRPVFADGFPRLGFLPGADGIYVAVAHPGVILAPLLGRLAMEEIVEGQRSMLVPGFNVAAFPDS